MASMSDERRKEMEEEMNRFEQEIAAPGETLPIATSQSETIGPSMVEPEMTVPDEPLPPPPAPAVVGITPEALTAPPPPPPAPPSPPHRASTPTSLPAPPPPPSVLPPPPRPPMPTMRFIPHQLQRHPPRPPMRPSFMGMRGPMGPFPPPGPFGPPMHHPMGPMHMNMPPCPPMHPMPMPPGFCPPHGGGMEHHMAPPFMPVVSSPGENPKVVTAGPAVYAAPFVKSQMDEDLAELVAVANGMENISTMAMIPVAQKPEKPLFTRITDEPVVGPTAPPIIPEEINVNKKREKKRKVIRMAGGQAWEDNSLQDWETDDFRIFCGDLGNDVTDEVLIRAFSKYPSFVKAKVIRDKRTNKTKGYGFVSFKDPQDFIKAMREMNGRYVGSRPIKLRKSTWRDRNIDLVKKKQREKEKLGLL